MARSLRIEYPGAVYHVMCRGNAGQDIFLAPSDRHLFLETMGAACEQTGWVVHAYVLMSNHYHVLLETPEANLVAGMKWFQGTYTQRFNLIHRRNGHLYQGRYKAIPVQADDSPDYFRQVSSYIHLNPFRAHLSGLGTGKPLENWKWSSYPVYAGKGKKTEWMECGRVYRSCGLQSRGKTSQRAYRVMIREQMNQASNPTIQSSLQQELRGIRRGWYYGDGMFRDVLLENLRVVGKGDNLRGEQRRSHGEKQAERLLKDGLQVLGLHEKDLRDLKASAIEKQALAWYIKSQTAVTGVWLSERLRMRDPSNVSRGLRRFRSEDSDEVRELKSGMTKCKG